MSHFLELSPDCPRCPELLLTPQDLDIFYNITCASFYQVYLPGRKINSTIMRFVTSESFIPFKQISYGGNINAISMSNIKPSYSSSDVNNTYNNSVEVDFGLIENKDVGSNATSQSENNTITLAFKVVLEDNDYVKNLSNYSVNIGMKTSSQTVWASKITFIANVASSRRPKVEIIASSNGSDGLNQGLVMKNFCVSYNVCYLSPTQSSIL